jgi:hypothetical protein
MYLFVFYRKYLARDESTWQENRTVYRSVTAVFVGVTDARFLRAVVCGGLGALLKELTAQSQAGR